MNKIIFSLIFFALIAAGLAHNGLADDAGGDIYYEQPVKGVIFSHAVHVDENGFDCETCHDDMFEMEAQAAEANHDFVMTEMEDGGYCGACHDGDMAFAVTTACATCHIGVKGLERANGISVTQQGH